MKIYNTLTKKEQKFEPINSPQVTMYNCGPTVYDYAHIGNWRSFLMADFLKRTLEYLGYEVKQVMNLTDVGHLTDNADQGEDKIEMRARQEKKGAQQIAEFYISAFQKDQRKLNISPPDKMPRATDHIQEMINLVKELEEKGYTYETSDGIYFDTSKFEDYGKLSGQSLEQKKAGARIEVSPEKKNPTDFALWKFSPKDQQRQQEWASPWGVGFPGWHIECSVLSIKYLGQPFDIHTGGIDHIGVHHENEIAQSEAAHGKPMAHYWIHVNFLEVKGEKISKSEGNFYTIEELQQKGYHPLAFRLLIFSSHYRKKQNFSFKALDQAQSNLEKIYRTARKVLTLSQQQEKNSPKLHSQQYEDKFKQSLEDDLNTPQALAVVLNFISDINKKIDTDKLSPSQAKQAYQLLVKWDRVLGIKIQEKASQQEEIPDTVQKLTQKRKQLRNKEQWEKADRIRKKINKLGYQIEDTSQGPQIHPQKD